MVQGTCSTDLQGMLMHGPCESQFDQVFNAYRLLYVGQNL